MRAAFALGASRRSKACAPHTTSMPDAAKCHSVSVSVLFPVSRFPFPPPRRRVSSQSAACELAQLLLPAAQHTDRIDRRHQAPVALSQKNHLHSYHQLPLTQLPTYTTHLPAPSPLSAACLGTIYLQPTSLPPFGPTPYSAFPSLTVRPFCVLPPLKPLPLSLPLITLCARMTKFRLASAYSFHPALPPPGAHKR